MVKWRLIVYDGVAGFMLVIFSSFTGFSSCLVLACRPMYKTVIINLLLVVFHVIDNDVSWASNVSIKNLRSGYSVIGISHCWWSLFFIHLSALFLGSFYINIVALLTINSVQIFLTFDPKLMLLVYVKGKLLSSVWRNPSDTYYTHTIMYALSLVWPFICQVCSRCDVLSTLSDLYNITK